MILVPLTLLETKLHVPSTRVGHVRRPRLRTLLEPGALPALTLVSAPPGFGKTTLLAEWVAQYGAGRAVAWVSLDHGDNDPVTFWTYVVSALGRAAPGAVDASLDLVDRTPAPPTRTLVVALLNDLASAARDVLLVLDDYHVIEAPELRDDMSFLLGNLPARTRVVIASRSDPPFPVARLRARGELLELRAADLRFTRDEAADYLAGMLADPVRTEDVDVLEQRTEGWIAALQLAALSMQRTGDIGAFVESFAGDDRYVLDYLVEEVLDHQPAGTRDFLLRTSILSRLSAGLCDAVTGGADAAARLEELDRANLFVLALDDRRRWYRYHHLFADALQAALLEEQPGRVAELHRRAAEWHEAHGEPGEALRHALAGGDEQRAADIIERRISSLRRSRQEVTLRRWLDALPAHVLAERPALAVAAAGSRLAVGDTTGVEELLSEAERRLAAAPDVWTAQASGMRVVDREAYPGLPGWVALYRLGSAQLRGDSDATVDRAERALELIPPDDHAGRGAVQSLGGLARWSRGDLDGAFDAFSAGMRSLDRAGFVTDVVGGTVVLADIRIAQGRLRDARALYEGALRRATGAGPALRGAADMHVGLAMLDVEANDLERAEGHLGHSDALGEDNGFPQNPYRSRVARARLAELRGDVDGALDLLEDAERVFTTDFSPDVRPIPALRARVLLRSGRTGEAARWAQDGGITPDADLGYLREFEQLTLARILLARARSAPGGGVLPTTVALLRRLLAAAEAGGRAGSALEAMLLLALAIRLQNDSRAAFATLDRALALAEQTGHLRLILDEGQPMESLLRAAAARSAAPRRLDDVLGAFGAARAPIEAPHGPLSERELQVLTLLGTDLSGPDIARELVVSLNTLRTHTKSINSKLGVGDRRAAVRRARELGLLRSRRL